jgi:hypothetical protein
LLGNRVEEAVGVFEDARCSLFLGRGMSHPVALEGALKDLLPTLRGLSGWRDEAWSHSPRRQALPRRSRSR